MKLREKLRSAGTAVPLLLLWVFPAVVGVALIHSADALEHKSVSPPGSVWSSIGERTISGETGVRVAVLRAAAQPLLAPLSGTVTTVNVRAGSLNAGDVWGTVDGTGVMAFWSRYPLYRPLGPGDRGRDVHALNTFLSKISLLPSFAVSDVYSSATSSAVAELQGSLGVLRTGRLSLPLFARIPRESVRVQSAVAPGDVVQQGQPVANLPGAVRSVSVKPVEGEGPMPAGHLVLTIRGASIEITGDRLTASQSARISRAVTSLETRTEAEGKVRFAAPLEVSTFPAMGVRTTSDGTSCVLVRDPGSSDTEVVVLGPTEAPQFELGTAFGPSSLIGKEVWSSQTWPSSMARKCR